MRFPLFCIGIIGFYVSWMILNWNDSSILGRPRQQMWNMGIWIFITFAIGATVQGIDNYAHFGGLIVGLLMGLAMTKESKPVTCIESKVKVLRVAAVILLFAYFVFSAYLTFFIVKSSNHC